MVRHRDDDYLPLNHTPLTEFIQYQTPDIPVTVRFIETDQSQRNEAERYIQTVFAQAYAAQITQFMPTLMALYGFNNMILAVLGLRSATGTSLFLEQYLNRPVEARLNEVLSVFDSQVARENMIEVGNLAATRSGGARWLIIALTAYLQGAGYHWTVFTALPALRNSFKRLGLKSIYLGDARLEDMPPACQANWGHYYDGQPQVVAVNVPHAYGVLDRMLRIEKMLHTMHPVWRDAYAQGATYLAQHVSEPSTVKKTADGAFCNR